MPRWNECSRRVASAIANPETRCCNSTKTEGRTCSRSLDQPSGRLFVLRELNNTELSKPEQPRTIHVAIQTASSSFIRARVHHRSPPWRFASPWQISTAEFAGQHALRPRPGHIRSQRFNDLRADCPARRLQRVAHRNLQTSARIHAAGKLAPPHHGRVDGREET